MAPNQPQTSTPPTPPDPQVAPEPGQKVQYTITQNSLNGLGGWLFVFMIVFAVMAIGEIGIFFSMLDTGTKNASDNITVVFAPILAIVFLASLVLTAMRKKMAIMVIYASFALFALYSILSQLVESSSDGVATKIGTAIVTVIIYGLMALYFRQSRRVKETLIK